VKLNGILECKPLSKNAHRTASVALGSSEPGEREMVIGRCFTFSNV
jgi:hypothetical protein